MTNFAERVNDLSEEIKQVVDEVGSFADVKRGRMTTAKCEALLGLANAIRELVSGTAPLAAPEPEGDDS
jgi:hypothetical protein